jgi:D-cysteine desulfhydrase
MAEKIKRIPLFERYPSLAERVAWMSIGQWPTSVARLSRFERDRNFGSLYIKREDLSHVDCGGNKVRGLEFLLADAHQRDIRRLLTFSSAGSHHIAKTAWHAHRLGMKTIALVVGQPNADYVRRNIAAALASDTEYVHANYLTILPRVWWRWWKEKSDYNLYRANQPNCGDVMFIEPGGTNRLSMLGHVNAAFELKMQIDAGELPAPDFLYAALGSLGTAAGLMLGLKLAGLRTRVVGVAVSHRWYCSRGRVVRFARRVNRWMREMDASVPAVQLSRDSLTIVRSALGRGYAHFTTNGERVAKAIHDAEGIRLDGAYTAKTLDGAMQFVQRNRAHAANHLFWHTYFEFPATDLTAADVPASVRRYFDSPMQPWPQI